MAAWVSTSTVWFSLAIFIYDGTILVHGGTHGVPVVGSDIVRGHEDQALDFGQGGFDEFTQGGLVFLEQNAALWLQGEWIRNCFSCGTGTCSLRPT